MCFRDLIGARTARLISQGLEHPGDRARGGAEVELQHSVIVRRLALSLEERVGDEGQNAHKQNFSNGL